MYLINDSVILDFLNDPSNNDEIDPILYLTSVFTNIRNSIDFSTEKKILDFESDAGNKCSILLKKKLDSHREEIFQYLARIEQTLIQKCQYKFKEFQDNLKVFAHKFKFLRHSSVKDMYSSIKNDLIGQDMFYIDEIPSNNSNESFGSLIVICPSNLDDIQIDVIE